MIAIYYKWTYNALVKAYTYIHNMYRCSWQARPLGTYTRGDGFDEDMDQFVLVEIVSYDKDGMLIYS